MSHAPTYNNPALSSLLEDPCVPQRLPLPTYQASDLYIHLKVHIDRLEGNKMDNTGCTAGLGHDSAARGAEQWTHEESSDIVASASSKKSVSQCESSPHAFLKRLC